MRRRHVRDRRSRCLAHAGVALALTGLLTVPALAAGQTAGGGGFRSTDDGAPALSGAGVAVIVLIAAVVLAAVAIPTWLRLRRRGARARRGAREAQIAELNDARFDPQALKARVREAFRPMQAAWSRHDVDAMRPYASEALLRRLGEEPGANGGRRPAADELRLDEVTIVHVDVDAQAARAVAYLAGHRRGSRRRAAGFGQLWTLVSDVERGWLVDDIAPAGGGSPRLSAPAVGPGVVGGG